MESPLQRAPKKRRKRREKKKEREKQSKPRAQNMCLGAQGIFQRDLPELEYTMEEQSWKRSFPTGETQLAAPTWKS